MSAQHTPGPWFTPMGAPYSVWKGSTQIASFRWINSTTGQPDQECVQNDAEARANASLAAAAPDLLAALQFVANSGFMPSVGTTRDLIEAAIAKATGGQA